MAQADTVIAPPIASLMATPDSGLVPLQTSFDASNSSSGLLITKYEFDFRDGNIYTETPTSNDGIFDGKTNHIYNSSGNYMAKLKITDSGNRTASDSLEIKVTEGPRISIELKNDDGEADVGWLLPLNCADSNYNAPDPFVVPDEYVGFAVALNFPTGPFKLEKTKLYFRRRNVSGEGFYLHVWDKNFNNLLPTPLEVPSSEVPLDTWWEKDLSQYNVSVNSSPVYVGICEKYFQPENLKNWAIGVDMNPNVQGETVTYCNGERSSTFNSFKPMVRTIGTIPTKK